jgi:hypothetical protein
MAAAVNADSKCTTLIEKLTEKYDIVIAKQIAPWAGFWETIIRQEPTIAKKEKTQNRTSSGLNEYVVKI